MDEHQTSTPAVETRSVQVSTPAVETRFILATRNTGKIREMNEILFPLGVETVSQKEAGVSVQVQETGETFAENAALKAKAVCEASGLPAIADDSGLCVDALNGGPGVYSARYGGPELDDAGRCRLVLNSVRGQTNRQAHFRCSIAAAFPNGDMVTAEGVCDGLLAFAPMGKNGFGYDPIFLYPSMGKTFAEMDDAEKNAVSHRGKALTAFAQALEDYLAAQRKAAEEAKVIATLEKQAKHQKIIRKVRKSLRKPRCLRVKATWNATWKRMRRYKKRLAL